MDISQVKKHLNTMVRFKYLQNDYEQLFTACILRIRDNKYYYQAELMAESGRSIMIRPLKDIYPAEGVEKDDREDVLQQQTCLYADL